LIKYIQFINISHDNIILFTPIHYYFDGDYLDGYVIEGKDFPQLPHKPELEYINRRIS
jgi:hypothetical protein